MLQGYNKSATVNHSTINHTVQTPWTLFLPSESSTLGYSCILKKGSYSETLAKHPVYNSNFDLLYIHHLMS